MSRASPPCPPRAFPERGGRGGAAVAQELLAAGRLVVLPDGAGRPAQHVQGPQEAPVRLVLPRDGPGAAPAGPAQLVQAAVGAGAGGGGGGGRGGGGEG